jgi:hypothetical protein
LTEEAAAVRNFSTDPPAARVSLAKKQTEDYAYIHTGSV